jgi:hypothetical protein
MSSNYDDTRDRDLTRDSSGASKAGDRKIDPETGDVIGEAAGGISGVLTGAALGSLGGPIGTIIGGIAGAIGGWWAGHAIAEAATRATNEDDYYRSHYEGSSTRLADRRYDDVRPAYQLGHLASQNPDYADRDFDAVESDLRRGWTSDVSNKHGNWDTVREYAREGYTRGRSNLSTGGAGATATDSAAYGVGRTADRVDSTTDRVGDKVEGAWENTKAGAERLGDKIERGLDNVKDRVDGDPASRPGPDATDRDRRF